MKVKAYLGIALRTLLILLSVYVILYTIRFFKANHRRWRETRFVKVSELPEEVRSCVELMGDPPESVEVIAMHQDIDGDGIAELIVDFGPYVRGAANFWYAIWKKQPSGIYHELGSFCADFYLFIPSLRIYGNPGILCDHGTIEWVPWKDGKYDCRGPVI